MIVYSATRKQFTEDVNSNVIEDKVLEVFQRRTGSSTTDSEIRSWRNSLQYMNNVLNLADTPDNAGVSIEYRIPQSSKRIDFILTGRDTENKETAVIVELKQWENVELTEMDGVVKTFINNGIREVSHPSYQAWTYAALLEDFNETVRDECIQLKPCAYLHNCRSNDIINHSMYREHTEKAPAFLRTDSQRLADFMKRYVKYGDNTIMYRIENSRISPSKHLADKLASMLQGNTEFIMIDDQKLVYEKAISMSEKGQKSVLIVEGGPGTGKSVVAVNLLVELTRRKKLVQYVTKNSAPRTVYEAKLTGSFRKSHITNLFKGSGAYTKTEENTFDVLVVDEAHRLNEKSGMFQNLGENQVKEIIHASRTSVFFIDEDQRVTFKDIGEKDEIRKWARRSGATIHEMELQSQFRCNGSDGYLAWLDNALQIRSTANDDTESLNYEIEVVDTPNQLRDLIFRKNRKDNKARLVAGYCWDWVSKKKSPEEHDIKFPEHDFSMKWNLSSDGNLWILKESAVNEIGCIHTSQGLELDYIGVIIGPDLIYRDGKLTTNPDARARTDKSLSGYKTLRKKNREEADRRADLIIRNTYRTLMSRGQKGCYIYCTDEPTAEYFRNLLKTEEPQNSEEAPEKYPGLNLEVRQRHEVEPYKNAVPIYNLKAAAGKFSGEQTVDETEPDWVILPDHIRISEGMFVIQVVGESMNRRIPNGSWCLFRKPTGGTREGKIVLVQHRDIYDEDHGGRYTVKKYHSEKVYSEDGQWRHERIVLRPETSAVGYDDIILVIEEVLHARVLGEYTLVL